MKRSLLPAFLILFLTQIAYAGISITSPSISSVYNVTTNQNFTVTCNATPPAGQTINRVNFYYWRDGAGVPLCTPNYPTTNPTECSVLGTGPTYTITNANIAAVPAQAGNDLIVCTGIVLNNMNINIPVGQELYVNVQAGVSVTIPTAPATISATTNSSSQITVSWSDSSNNETTFELQRATNSGFTTGLTTVSTSIAANTTSYVVTGLAASTTYFFRVRATNSAGSSVYKSMTTGVATQAASVTAPSAPASITGIAISSSQINVSWTSVSGATSYALEIARNNTFTTGLVSLGTAITGTSSSATGLLASTMYFFRAKANNSAGSSAWTISAAITTPAATVTDTTAPSVPGGLSASGITSSTINLSWSAATDNVGVTAYEISINNAAAIAVGASPVYYASGLSASTTYNFKVRAKDAAGNTSAYSTAINATTSAVVAVPTFNSNNSTNVSVTAYATVQANSITLKWGNISGVTHNTATIFRKTKTSTTWTQVGTTAGSNNQYVDATVAVGTYYEYKIQIPNSSGATAYGYVASGIQVPVVENRGKLILVIDPAVSSLSGMSSRLTTLSNDLKSDGWTLVEIASSSTSATLKASIVSAYNADPTNVKAVFLIGHPAVARSGLYFGPDGHGDHKGPWAADGYFADMNGTWTDTGTHTANTNSYYFNYPSDGMFDQNNFPSALELQIGRVDLYFMDEFSANYGIAHDPVLYNAYFDRLHNYKVKATVPQNRAFIQDNFVEYNFAQSGFKNFSSLVGPANITSRQGSSPTMFGDLNNQSYLFAYGCGSGGHLSAAGISTTSELSNGNWGGVFNFTFGSYFGEWQSNNNNFLRAMITGGAGLTDMWIGATQGYFHNMSMGDTIGYSAQLTMNNKISGIYYPETAGTGTGVGSYDNVELSLMGDPTLRINMIAPPSNLSVNISGNLLFSWSAPVGETGVSYIVYEVGANGGLTRVTATPVTGTSYQSTISNAVQNKNYIVKTYKLINSQTGSYYDTSVGSNVVTR